MTADDFLDGRGNDPRKVAQDRFRMARRSVTLELFGMHHMLYVERTNTGRRRAIRWLIALMVLCCDPLAIASTAAASAPRQTTV